MKVKTTEQLLAAGRHSNLRRESWFDPNLYPFQSNFVTVEAGQMHYIDEGEGTPILFVHGMPTWSFLFRDQIRTFSGSYRCIAPDHIGFGLSEKPPSFEGTPQAHARNLAELVGRLGLENITLVVHDFGGPIGLAFANAHPKKVRRVVLLNTWLWETRSENSARRVDKLLNSWLGKFLYLRLNFSPRFLLRQAFADKKNLPRAVHQHYTQIFPDRQSRYGLLKIGQSLVGASDWYAAQWEQLEAIAGKPFQIIWGLQDEFLKTEYLEKWKARLPQAEVITLDCGHFLTEERPGEVTTAISHFMKGQP
ncbi:MAG: alpha/beta fold hydrolase [Lewinellaceae bacterium]|nr:alpha/beta fold hydrolase [Phaeodactylibacter sp.]MCB9035766.1 alpha/beta fold hydrolase [Lewinellaceae bacterium]